MRGSFSVQKLIASVEVIGSTSQVSPVQIFRSEKPTFDAEMVREVRDASKEERRIDREDRRTLRRRESSINPRLGGDKLKYAERPLPPSNVRVLTVGVNAPNDYKNGLPKVEDIGVEDPQALKNLQTFFDERKPAALTQEARKRSDIAKRGDFSGTQQPRALEASFAPGGVTGVQVQTEDRRPAKSIEDLDPNVVKPATERRRAKKREAEIFQPETPQAKRQNINGEREFIQYASADDQDARHDEDLLEMVRREHHIQNDADHITARRVKLESNAKAAAATAKRYDQLVDEIGIVMSDYTDVKIQAKAAATRAETFAKEIRKEVQNSRVKGHQGGQIKGCRQNQQVRDGIVKRGSCPKGCACGV